MVSKEKTAVQHRDGWYLCAGLNSAQANDQWLLHTPADVIC